MSVVSRRQMLTDPTNWGTLNFAEDQDENRTMAQSGRDIPRPALERVTGIERKLWSAAIERQYRSPRSSYRRNLPWYGEVGATYLSVANLWLLLSFPFILSVFVSQIVENGPLLVVALVGTIVCLGESAVRLYKAIRVGRSWRQDHGVRQPPRWKSRNPYQPPEGGETTPPIGWAQTSKVPPGWNDPDVDFDS